MQVSAVARELAQPNGSPENEAPAAKTSGYIARSATV